jgi:hypothetical protein
LAGYNVAELPVPARADTQLDRGAVERVLARAAELQAGSAGTSSELLTESQLIDIAKEVGLEPVHVRQALAEERTQPSAPIDHGWIAEMFGTGSTSATRTVTGAPDAVLTALDRWMRDEECLRVQRRFADGLVWEPRSDLFGMLRRGIGIGGHGYALASASSVRGTVVGLDAARTLVRLDADISDRRAWRLRTASAVASAGMVGAIVVYTLAVAMSAIAVVPLAGGAAAAWALARGHRGLVARTRLALEQALDRVQFGDARAPRSLASMIGAAARPLLR